MAALLNMLLVVGVVLLGLGLAIFSEIKDDDDDSLMFYYFIYFIYFISLLFYCLYL